ncbi:MAG: MarR family transcriptional regulator [Candidatus Woesearchaeota archaeon]
MRNKVVGYIILGMSALIGFIVYSFNSALGKIINESCEHGPACPMWGTLDFQTNVGIGIMVFVIMIGIYLIFFGKEEVTITKIETRVEKVEPKDVSRENYRKVINRLIGDEKKLFEILIDSKGTIMQSDMIAKSEMSKVKISRVLDKLEGKGLIERKRRGMTNSIVLKH